MKKLLVLLLALFILMGVGCNNNINEPPITENKNIVADDNFNKKIECAKLKDSIIEKIKKYNGVQKPEIRNSNPDLSEPINDLYIENKELKEVFFSPKENSCLYVESRRTLFKPGAGAKPNIGEWNIYYETYYLIDALSGREVDFNDGLSFIETVHRGEPWNSELEVEILINEYK